MILFYIGAIINEGMAGKGDRQAHTSSECECVEKRQSFLLPTLDVRGKTKKGRKVKEKQ